MVYAAVFEEPIGSDVETGSAASTGPQQHRRGGCNGSVASVFHWRHELATAGKPFIPSYLTTAGASDTILSRVACSGVSLNPVASTGACTASLPIGGPGRLR